MISIYATNFTLFSSIAFLPLVSCVLLNLSKLHLYNSPVIVLYTIYLISNCISYSKNLLKNQKHYYQRSYLPMHIPN